MKDQFDVVGYIDDCMHIKKCGYCAMKPRINYCTPEHRIKFNNDQGRDVVR